MLHHKNNNHGKGCQPASQPLLLEGGGQPPADPPLQPWYPACYRGGKRFNSILPDVILAINTRERESSEEAVTRIDLRKYLLT